MQFGVAVNHTWKTESGEQKQSVTFVDVTAWRRQAEVIAQYFRKGDPILIEGRLAQDAWVDKQTQQKHTKIKVVLEQFSFVKTKAKGEGEEPPPRQSPGTGQPAGKPPSRPSNPEPAEPEDDDIPF